MYDESLPVPSPRDPTAWGTVGDALADAEHDAVGLMLSQRFGADTIWRSSDAQHELQDPRVHAPDPLAHLTSDVTEDRLLHAVGRSFTDMVALRETGVRHAPDLVARPRTPDEVEAVLGWCADAGIACIPFGGGTSVVGGVTAGAVDGPVVALQTRAMDRVLEVDTTSRAALVEAGATGPGLEAQLRPHDLTMRFFPQSFEMSTLGGWVATRAGGHYATRLTHIDDLVESIDAVTPNGRWSSRRLPGSGAGPSPDRMLLGSEGTLGVITSAWVRLQDQPVHRGGMSVTFDDFADALAALRPLVQSGLDPANCRVLDPGEAYLNGAGDGTRAVMVVGAESPAVPVDADLSAMAELLADHGGEVGTVRIRGRQLSTRDGDAADAWKQAFLRAPYLRDALVDHGMIIETFETAATWDRLGALVERVRAATASAVEEVCGQGIVTCRITHAYPDGAAPYFTVIAPGRRGARASQWAEVKQAASEVLLAEGGTITHHHAVGRDHRPWYDRQRPDLFATALGAVRAVTDPAGIMNPGVLLG